MPTIWTDEKDGEFMRSFIKDTVALIEEKAKAAGVYYPFVYLNDAAGGQAVFEHYGGGESLPKMKQISKKYDPEGFLQKLEATGFKLDL